MDLRSLPRSLPREWELWLGLPPWTRRLRRAVGRGSLQASWIDREAWEVVFELVGWDWLLHLKLLEGRGRSRCVRVW